MPKCILSGQVKSSFTQEQADGRYLQLSGGTMIGAIKMPEAHAFEALDGDGNVAVELGSSGISFVEGSGGAYITAESSNDSTPVLAFYGLWGDEPVILKHINTPQSEKDAATKGYVDGLIGDINAQLGTFVQKTANLSGTDYTTIRARGIQLVSSAPGTLPNGCIAIVYS